MYTHSDKTRERTRSAPSSFYWLRFRDKGRVMLRPRVCYPWKCFFIITFFSFSSASALALALGLLFFLYFFIYFFFYIPFRHVIFSFHIIWKRGKKKWMQALWRRELPITGDVVERGCCYLYIYISMDKVGFFISTIAACILLHTFDYIFLFIDSIELY